jgi:ABC-type antimicrobial peptide transport system permease subunit
VCVIGETLKRELFQRESPIGKEIRINNVSFRVLGVLSRKGANMMGMDQDDVVLAPWTTIKYRVAGTTLSNGNQSGSAGASSSSTSTTVNTLSNLYPASTTSLYATPSATEAADTPQPIRFTNVDQILAKATSENETEQAMGQITELLRERHRIRPGETEDFNIRDMTELTRTLASASQTMGTLLLVVAMISLVVGGVGIMNIMLVSVTERTREIGIRLAVGARGRDILRQFLLEAIVLSTLGGVIGVALGVAASIATTYLVNTFVSGTRWPLTISVDAILVALVFAGAVGMFFGYYPARKASRLDPIESLRYE